MRKHYSLGPIISIRELSLYSTVVLYIRRPPTIVGTRDFAFPRLWRLLFFYNLRGLLSLPVKTKQDARKIASQVRAKLHTQYKDNAGRQLADVNFSDFAINKNAIVSGYLPYRSEIDVTGLMRKLSDQGWKTCLPVVTEDGHPLSFRRWSPGEETVAGRWGISVPPLAAETVEPDVLLVPLLSFDRKGFRLGYGGGFYDRTIEILRDKKAVLAIGVAYAGQQVDKVPHDNHDQPLDMFITEKGIIECV